MEEKLREAIVGILDQKPGCYQQSDGTFLCEIYANYRDEMDSKTAVEILQARTPQRRSGSRWTSGTAAMSGAREDAGLTTATDIGRRKT